MGGCLGSIVTFIIFLIVFTVMLNSNLLSYMGGSLHLFNDLMMEVLKSLISIIQGGVYIPDNNFF